MHLDTDNNLVIYPQFAFKILYKIKEITFRLRYLWTAQCILEAGACENRATSESNSNSYTVRAVAIDCIVFVGVICAHDNS